MKLIKLSEEHYIVVDDTEIKEGDYVIEDIGSVVYGPIDEDAIVENPRKITHSTQPLEDVGLNTSMGWQLGFDKIEPIYLSEVKELLGVVDVEKMAEEALISHPDFKAEGYSDYQNGRFNGIVEGYKQAIEDNKEMVSLKDLKKFLAEGRYTISKDAGGNITADFTELMSLLTSPKTEWDVEIVNGKLALKK